MTKRSALISAAAFQAPMFPVLVHQRTAKMNLALTSHWADLKPAYARERKNLSESGNSWLLLASLEHAQISYCAAAWIPLCWVIYSGRKRAAERELISHSLGAVTNETVPIHCSYLSKVHLQTYSNTIGFFCQKKIDLPVLFLLFIVDAFVNFATRVPD